MNGQPMLYIDQYGNKFYASTVSELKKQVSGRCSKMYCDDNSGNSFHTGYVIGQHWLSMYSQVRLPEGSVSNTSEAIGMLIKAGNDYYTQD